MPRPNPPDCAPSGMTNVPCPGRVAILSHVLPPAPSGQAAVLERLLQAWPHDEYRLISGAETIGDVQASSSGFLLRVHRYTRGLLRQTRFHGIVSAVDFALRLLGKAVTISRILKRETCRAIVACTGDLLDLPAACLAGWWTRVPFYIYVFDDYERQWVNPRAGGFAKRWMPRMIWRAAGVIVTNERLRDELRSALWDRSGNCPQSMGELTVNVRGCPAVADRPQRDPNHLHGLSLRGATTSFRRSDRRAPSAAKGRCFVCISTHPKPPSLLWRKGSAARLRSMGISREKKSGPSSATRMSSSCPWPLIPPTRRG